MIIVYYLSTTYFTTVDTTTLHLFYIFLSGSIIARVSNLKRLDVFLEVQNQISDLIFLDSKIISVHCNIH